MRPVIRAAKQTVRAVRHLPTAVENAAADASKTVKGYAKQITGKATGQSFCTVAAAAFTAAAGTVGTLVGTPLTAAAAASGAAVASAAVCAITSIDGINGLHGK
jgi:hypothetical protein